MASAKKILSVCGLFWLATAMTPSKADENYNFTFSGTDGNKIFASGNVTTIGDLNGIVTSANGYFTISGVSSNFDTAYTSNFSPTGVFLTLVGPNGTAFNLRTGFGTILMQEGNSFSGNAIVSASVGGTTVFGEFGGSPGLFIAVSTSGGISGGSGGAPSPEVNAFLGLALAGGTIAFLRRKRGVRREMTAT